MRHGKKVNHLGRKAGHRRALLANLAISLINHKRIKTTVAKAKALRKYVEPLMTKAKSNTTHNRRVVFSYLQNKEALKELFDEIGGKIADRPGGYTRILKIGFRPGDGAEMAIIELVDYNEDMLNAPKQATKKTRRGRKKKKKEETTNDAVAAGTVAETVTDTATETVTETTETVAEKTTETVTETTETITENVTETVTETTETVTETVSEVVEDAPKAEDVVEETPQAEKTEDAKDEAGEDKE